MVNSRKLLNYSEVRRNYWTRCTGHTEWIEFYRAVSHVLEMLQKPCWHTVRHWTKDTKLRMKIRERRNAAGWNVELMFLIIRVLIYEKGWIVILAWLLLWGAGSYTLWSSVWEWWAPWVWIQWQFIYDDCTTLNTWAAHLTVAILRLVHLSVPELRLTKIQW